MSENPYRKPGVPLHPHSLMYKLAEKYDRENVGSIIPEKKTLRINPITKKKAESYHSAKLARVSLSQTPRINQPDLSITIPEESPTEPKTPKAL